MPPDRIYTKVGDKGSTSLATGQRVSKAHLRIEAYGTVDELNAYLGLCADRVGDLSRAGSGDDSLVRLGARLRFRQHELFKLGAELAIPLSALEQRGQSLLDAHASERLEQEMDEAMAKLPPLRNFILPGGHPLVAELHIARCVCRRAERAVVRLHDDEATREVPRIYLNRLSDWLFTMARLACLSLACQDILWQPDMSSPQES